jgi:hypothetical protein
MNNILDHISKPCAAFAEGRLLAAGPLIEVALAIKNAPPDAHVLAFDDATGEVVDLDLRGTKQEIIARLAERPKGPAAAPERPKAEPRGPGRPKLGVVAREVTLLPRHWDWLAAQPGGASVTLRKLVEAARRGGETDGRRRAAREAAYRFMTAMAGDLPGFEEAIRALFAGDRARFDAQMAGWPKDIRDYALRLAAGGLSAEPPFDA